MKYMVVLLAESAVLTDVRQTYIQSLTEEGTEEAYFLLFREIFFVLK